MNRVSFVTLALSFFHLSTALLALDGRAILDRLWMGTAASGEDKLILQINLVYTKDSQQSESRAEVYTLGGRTALILLKEDRTKPIVILRRAESYWLYKQGLRTPLRISGNYRATGPFSVTDVVGITMADYEMNGENMTEAAHQLSLQSTNRKSAYPYVQVSIDPVKEEVFRIVYQGFNRRPIKEALLKNYHLIEGELKVADWHVEDLIFGGKGVLRYLDIKGHDLPVIYFTPTSSALAQFLRRTT